jgi:hypothetical protein
MIKNFARQTVMSNCVKSGNLYETLVYDILKICRINGTKKFFNTQKENEIGGSSCRNDLECNLKGERDVKIEVKKCKTPDWMQSSIQFIDNTWKPTNRNKIPEPCAKVFEDILKNATIFNNEVPPFMSKKLTHSEWTDIKKSTKTWKDQKLDIPSDTIRKLYTLKGCNYIQISDYGLYYLDKDICNFGVPLFEIEQELRIRTKVHSKKNKNGFCVLSVTAACKPKNIKKLIKSEHSLDNLLKLPKNMHFIM